MKRQSGAALLKGSSASGFEPVRQAVHR
jgi:hypothetical protein